MSTATPEPPKLPPEYVASAPFDSKTLHYSWIAVKADDGDRRASVLARIRAKTPVEVQITDKAHMPEALHTFPTWDEALRYVETICALGEL